MNAIIKTFITDKATNDLSLTLIEIPLGSLEINFGDDNHHPYQILQQFMTLSEQFYNGDTSEAYQATLDMVYNGSNNHFVCITALTNRKIQSCCHL
jgi:ornithine carbamoyltransferase